MNASMREKITDVLDNNTLEAYNPKAVDQLLALMEEEVEKGIRSFSRQVDVEIGDYVRNRNRYPDILPNGLSAVIGRVRRNYLSSKEKK